MRTKVVALFLVSLLLQSTGARESGRTGARLAQEVRALVNSLAETDYQHKTEIDEAKRTWFCDCSGFLGYLLKERYPLAHRSLDGEEAPWRKRPLAVTFHETFLRAGETDVPGWSRVEKLTDVLPGDFIAWRKDEVVRGESTGHVLLVVGTPQIEDDGRVRLRIVDSTSRTHSDDTRPKGTDGVGEGTMWFGMDENGKPNAYYVDRDAKAGKSTQIAIGRLRD